MKHPFSSDRPITSGTEDLLGRKRFSERLADALLGWREKDSLILGIYGKWGDGKSSVKNMVLETLGKPEKGNAPTVVEFSPWQWQDENSLAEAFFQEIAIKLGKLPDAKKAKELAHKWQEYAAYLQLSNTAFDSTLAITRWFFGLTGLASMIVSFLIPEWFRSVLGLVGAVAFIASLFTGFLEKISAPIAKLTELRANKSKQSLADLKASLSSELSTLRQPFVVVIDDVDRLRRQEIRALVQIVKANADFPNFIYLMFFQRDIIEKSLDEEGVYAGADYLEKIVQVHFNLPSIPQDKVHNVLTAGIEAVLNREGVFDKFDLGRWHSVFIPGLSKYFLNLRDVNRFLSTFGFHLGILKTEGALQVNPIDLIALEVLRQFDSPTYDGIFANKEIFTGDPPGRDSGSEAKKKVVSDLIDKNSSPTAVKAIFECLFPNVKWCYSNYHTSVSEADLRLLRVNHEKIFDRYFQLELPEGDLSQSELDKAMALTGNRDEFVLFLKGLHRRELLPTFVSRFEAYKQEVDLAHAVPFTTAMFDVGDLLLDDGGGFMMTSESMHARRIIHWFLKKESDSKKRKDYIFAALKQTTGIFLPLDWIRDELRKEERQNYPDAYNFEEPDFPELKKIGIEIVNRAIQSGFLNTSRHLVRILFAWLSVDEEKNVRNWVSELITTDAGLLHFVISFVSKSYSSVSGSYSARISFYVQPKAIEYVADFNKVYERVMAIDQAPLSEEEKRACVAVIEAKDRLDHPEKYKDHWRI